MTKVHSIHNSYNSKAHIVDRLNNCKRLVIAAQNNKKLSKNELGIYSLSCLHTLSKEIDIRIYAILFDVVDVGTKYYDCKNEIDKYREAMINGNNTIIHSAIDKLDKAENAYNSAKQSFEEKYSYSINSAEALIRIIPQCIDNAISKEEKEIHQLIDEARRLLEKDYSTELKMTDPMQLTNVLPHSMMVARYSINDFSKNFLNDIGKEFAYSYIESDLFNNGNIIVCTDYEHISDDAINEFIVSYSIRFIESYPIGAACVHIIDPNPNYLIKRLCNCFQREDTGEGVGNTVQIHSKLSDANDISDRICDDVFKKTSVSIPDLYAIHEIDKSDQFNLIIIRNGLVDGNGYASTGILNKIETLTNPSDIGHRCGIRFLIIDDSSSYVKSLTENNRHIIDSIYDNCELEFIYSDKRFSLDGKAVEVLHTKGSSDAFIQERTELIVKAIGGKEKNVISLNDVSDYDNSEEMGNIMYIPVGKSGDKIIELPFSCKDEGETVAGQCIGYMAIGQSGSGKSSFFHSVVLNGCLKYSPKDLQFWLLDFKNGGASSKYSKCGIPHIRIIAENNKIDDALCLFQMVLEEMERRTKAFNKSFTDNIVEYNKKADLDITLEYFPRIIIAIDEVQEIFRDDNASVIQKLISSISARMRSAGMHFVMIAQNLSEGKSYMLKGAFLPSATGRICFRVSQDIPRDSGFDNEFIERKKEISELKTGESYVSYGKNTIKKVKMAYVSPEAMKDCFAAICNKYQEFAHTRPLVIGSKQRLAITDSMQGTSENYHVVMASTTKSKGSCSAVIAEDVYRMNPLTIRFSQHENSSVLFLGSDKEISSSLCTSVTVSLIKQGVRIHLFNGDRTRIQDDYELIPHPFMYLCQNINRQNESVTIHRLDQLKDVLCDLYDEYLKRQELVQKADYEDPVFEPVFLVVNDLFGIESFVSNEVVEKTESQLELAEKPQQGLGFNYDIFGEEKTRNDNRGCFRESIQNIMGYFLKNGYRYNIHMILSIKGDPITWRNLRLTSEINNVVLFNDTEFAEQIENAYFLKEMLKNISNDGEKETLAVWSSKKTFSKIRPILYDLSIPSEKELLDKLIGG